MFILIKKLVRILYLKGDSYKSSVYKGINHVEVEKVDDPKIEKTDDIVVKVTSTAICGSDLHLVHGMIPNTPHGFVLGHETMAMVNAITISHLVTSSLVILPLKWDNVLLKHIPIKF